MVRIPGKQKSARFVFLCVGLLGFGLIADYLWASSPKFAPFSDCVPVDPSKVIIPENTQLIMTPNQLQRLSEGDKDKKVKKSDGQPGRFLSATFSDLPRPQLEWEKMAAAPVPRLDGAAIQIKDRLFVFAGYGTIDYESILFFT